MSLKENDVFYEHQKEIEDEERYYEKKYGKKSPLEIVRGIDEFLFNSVKK